MSTYYPSVEVITILTSQLTQSSMPYKWLQNYINLLGSNIRVFLPMYESNPGAAADVTDVGPRGHHFDNVTAFDDAPKLRGHLLAYTFNGTDEGLSLADHSDFTFGTGAADSALSVGCWFKAEDSAGAAIESLISRIDKLAPNNEWTLNLSAAHKIGFDVYDNSVPAYEGRLYNTAITFNRWYFVVATYDATAGATASTGIDIYLAEATASSISAVDDTAHDNGVYVAMEDKAVLTTVGYSADGGAGAAEWFQGEMWGPFVVAEELSAAQVTALFHQGKKLLGFE
jgi:hypothetical protein